MYDRRYYNISTWLTLSSDFTGDGGRAHQDEKRAGAQGDGGQIHSSDEPHETAGEETQTHHQQVQVSKNTDYTSLSVSYCSLTADSI